MCLCADAEFPVRVIVLRCCSSLPYKRVTRKISSVCEYCSCSAAVTMMRMRTQFVDSVTRHGHNLHTFEQFLRIVLCVHNV